MNNKKLSLIVLTIVCDFLMANADTLKLSTAYEMALKNEPHLRAEALKTISGIEGIEQSRAKLYPQINGSTSLGRYEYEYTAKNNPVKETYTNYSISATQALYHPELWRGIDEAQSRQKGSEYQLQAKKQQLGLDVAKAYFNLLYTQQNVELIESQKSYYEGKYRQQEEMLKMGLTNRIDLLETKVHQDQATAQWLGEKRKLQVAKLKLEHFVGEGIDKIEQFDFTQINVTKFNDNKDEWKAKINNNPTFKTAIYAEEAARHQVAIREYEHYPKVDFSLTRKETYTQDLIAHKYDNQAIAQVNIPLYQGGYTQSRIKEGKLLLESARKDLDYYRQETLYQLEDLLAQRELNMESLEVLKASEVSAQLYLETVEKGHAVGLKSLVDVLEAKAKLYDVRRQLVETGHELVSNQLGLFDVTGELSVETIAEYEKSISR